MTHIITSLCLRDAGCVDVCPVECIVPGKPVDQWPWFYIDPDTCIDCGACIPVPFEAIFTETRSWAIRQGDRSTEYARGTAGFDQVFDGKNHHGEAVHLDHTKALAAGEVVDLKPDIKPNYDYFKGGPGYKALEK
jgi:NAD-dependent dihydropyrimidine dehydrogenase PreA subunit